MKTSREQFDEWFSAQKERMMSCGLGMIHIRRAHDAAWAAWQASRQYIEVETPELLTTPVKQFEFERDCQWKEAISKAGIKVKGA